MPTEAKVAFVEALADAGLPVVEVTSFVSPKAVPQLADADEVLPRVHRRTGVRYPVLVPNMRGHGACRASGRRRGRRVHRRIRGVQRAEHRHDDRGVTRGVRAGARSCAGARLVATRIRLDRVRMPVLGRGRAGAGRRGLRRRCSSWAATRSRSATRSASLSPTTCARVCDALLARRAGRAARVASARHERPGARQRAGRTRAWRLGLRLVGRRHGRMSVRTGRSRQPRDRVAVRPARSARHRTRGRCRQGRGPPRIRPPGRR